MVQDAVFFCHENCKVSIKSHAPNRNKPHSSLTLPDQRSIPTLPTQILTTALHFWDSIRFCHHIQCLAIATDVLRGVAMVQDVPEFMATNILEHRVVCFTMKQRREQKLYQTPKNMESYDRFSAICFKPIPNFHILK